MAFKLSEFVSPATLRTTLRSNTAYLVNRDRAAAVVHDGLAYYEKYEKARPYIFWGSLIGFAASSFALYKRRKKGAEAWVVYGTSAAACATAAWFTRPRGEEAAAVPGAPAVPGAGVIGYLDRRVAALSQEDRNFADTAFTKLVNFPGIKPQWDNADPLIKAAIL